MVNLLEVIRIQVVKILYNYLLDEPDVSPSLPSPRGRVSVQPITDGLPSPALAEEALDGVEKAEGVELKSGIRNT